MCWNFVFGKIRCEIKTWNQTLRENILCVTIRTLPINFVLSFIFKFRKYYTVYNSGLKIWLVSGIFEMAQLFNLKFWLYLWRLGVGFLHIFKPRNVVYNIFSELTLKASLLFFRKKFNEIATEKSYSIIEIRTELWR